MRRMAPEPSKPPVLFIIGPTTSGKTAAALGLAERLPIEVINADSRQVYRHMSIGTAKPTAAEQSAAPHHLFDVVNPDEPFSLGAFLDLARGVIADVQARGRLPVVVGGTGQYVWALVEGWQVPRVTAQPDLRRRLEEEAEQHGAEALHARLRRIDPGAADAIHPNNVRRIVRAIEVFEATGQRFSDQQRREDPPFAPRVTGVLVPRGELHRRIDERIARMVADGWVEEVRALLAMGYTPELPAFSSAGYREVAAHLAGELSLEEALERARIAHRTLVRRQALWFRASDERIAWSGDPARLLAAAEAALG